jgi:alanyl-tRNA synthetase
MLASKIVETEPAIALLATRQADGARLVFARSTSLSEDMGKLMAEACETLGGRGGGRPNLAQGGAPSAERIDQAIQTAADKVMAVT